MFAKVWPGKDLSLISTMDSGWEHPLLLFNSSSAYDRFLYFYFFQTLKQFLNTLFIPFVQSDAK